MNKCSVQTTVRFSGEKWLITLCSGVFLYVRYSFPLISNKFCDKFTALATVQGGIEMFWGGGGAVR